MKKSGLFVSLLLLGALLTASVSYRPVFYEIAKTECKVSVKEDKRIHENYNTCFRLHQPVSGVFHRTFSYNESAAHQHICGVEFPPPDCRA